MTGPPNAASILVVEDDEPHGDLPRGVVTSPRPAAPAGHDDIRHGWFVRHALSNTRPSGSYTRTGWSIGLARAV